MDFGNNRPIRAQETASRATYQHDCRVETKMMAADSRYYQEKRYAEAQLYERELEAHGRSAVVEMRNRQKEADTELYAKQKVSEVMVEAVNGEAYYVDEMLTALGGNYMAQRDYLMINEGVHQEITWATSHLGRGPSCCPSGPGPTRYDNLKK
ncbi:hypothetical protein EJ110_NYTH11301 [Nymphaea thermarum]|nr:hypothetical protein EJ110_NYTH11301 [Nymphaea thermarum]